LLNHAFILQHLLSNEEKKISVFIKIALLSFEYFIKSFIVFIHCKIDFFLNLQNNDY